MLLPRPLGAYAPLLELQERAFPLKLATWTLSVGGAGLILSLDPDAASYTDEQLVRVKTIPLLLSPSLLLGLLYFMYELFVILPYTGKLSQMFTRMIKNNVSTWFVLFFFFLLMFWLAIFMVLPRGGADEVVDPSVALLWNLVLFSFTGDQNYDFDFMLEGEYTRDWAWDDVDHFVGIAMPRIFLIFFYVLFMVISLVVLLNLLIAMMSSEYETVEKESIVSYKHKKARRTLRMELLTRFFIKPEQQKAGIKGPSGKYVYAVRTTERNVEGQQTAGGSDIFADNADTNKDGVPDAEQQPEWARRLEVQLGRLEARSSWRGLLEGKSQPHAPGKTQQPQPQPKPPPQPHVAPMRQAPPAPYLKQRTDTMDFSGSIEPTLRVHSAGLAAAVCEPPLPPIHQHHTPGYGARRAVFVQPPELPLAATPGGRPPQRSAMQAVGPQDSFELFPRRRACNEPSLDSSL